MTRIYKVFLWVFIFSFTMGFHILQGKWQISKTDPTIWLRFCSTNITIETNDISGDDPLANLSNLTFTQVMQSVINDYNNIPSSYLRLAFYPTDPNNPDPPVAGDSAFTIALAEKRIIDICFGNTNPAAGLSGGHSQAKYENREIVGCEINIRSEHTKKAKFLTQLLTHEIGHCFGLMHPQESTQSVMSYFNEEIIRLKNDDYAGITFRYPEEDSYAQEYYTLGLSGCSPR